MATKKQRTMKRRAAGSKRTQGPAARMQANTKVKNARRSAAKSTRSLVPVRRIVTGHDDSGRSIVASDAVSPFTFAFPNVPDYGATDLWRTNVPADNAASGETCRLPFVAEPPAGGAVFRIVQFPPDRLFLRDFDRDSAFKALADGEHAVKDTKVRNPTMHRTKSVDFAVVIKGEIFALLDVGEVKMKQGDTLVQRGTVHGWSNRSRTNCLVAFVLVDAEPVGAEHSH